MKNSIKFFDYNLPSNLIAENPRSKREQAKLMIYDQGLDTLNHSIFSNLDEYLTKGDLIILNDTRVLPGRLFLKKESGGTVEILFHKRIDQYSFVCIFKSSRKVAIHSKLFFDDENFFLVDNIENNFITLSSKNDPMNIFLKYGEVPLPKYIKRDPTPDDKERYQTIYAKNEGAVAAPTAGLHFSRHLLKKMEIKGVNIAEITLHVGLGTFNPVEVEDLSKHKMDSEELIIGQQAVDIVNESIRKKKRICAVGTTVMRGLESSVSSINT